MTWLRIAINIYQNSRLSWAHIFKKVWNITYCYPPLSIEISCSLGLSQCKRARCNGLWPDIVKGEQLNIMNLTYNTLCSIFKETTREHCKVRTKSLIMHMRCAKDEKVFLWKFSRWLTRRYVQNAVKQLYQAPIQLLWICRIGE